MSNKPDNKSTRGQAAKQQEYTGWRVLAIFLDGVFALFNSNKIYPAFGMMCFLLAGLIVWRLPDTELAIIVKLAIEKVATTTGGLLGLLIATNLGWVALFSRSRALYRGEINRISLVKQDLIHGDITPIKKRRSSETAVTETYIVPARQEKE